MRITVPAGRQLRRPADVDVSDLTAAVRDGDPFWDGDDLVIPFVVDPTPTEQSAIKRRLFTEDAAHESRVRAAADALAALDTVTDVPPPVLDALRLLLTDALADIPSEKEL